MVQNISHTLSFLTAFANGNGNVENGNPENILKTRWILKYTWICSVSWFEI